MESDADTIPVAIAFSVAITVSFAIPITVTVTLAVTLAVAVAVAVAKRMLREGQDPRRGKRCQKVRRLMAAEC